MPGAPAIGLLNLRLPIYLSWLELRQEVSRQTPSQRLIPSILPGPGSKASLQVKLTALTFLNVNSSPVRDSPALQMSSQRHYSLRS
jgi:hypothetical protein